MKSVLVRFYKILCLFGFDPLLTFRSFRSLFVYLIEYSLIKKQKGKDTLFPFGQTYPILAEKYLQAGTMNGHYFHQDLYVAQKVFENNPLKHLDIGSRIDGFVAHVAVFRKIEIIDIRSQESKIENISFRKADLMILPKDMISSYDSISSLHAIEHFGLGRYGDPIDYWGYLKALNNITQILQTKGKLYFSVPIGPQRIEFNAQRVFSVVYLIDLLSKNYNIDCFSFVDDKGDFFENVELDNKNVENNFGCYFGCGIFELTKK